MSNEEHEAFGFKTNINLYKGKMIGDMLYPLSVLITFFLINIKMSTAVHLEFNPPINDK